MSKVSVLILARNEENNIKDCIESCNFADEVIVIDDNSTDKTKEIAEQLGARVINRSMNGDWGGQQTFAIQQAKYEWIFFIDADERCTPELGKEIRETIKKNEHYAYWIKRKNKFHHNKATHGTLRPGMYHHTYETWEQHINKINKYTTLAAEKYKEEGKTINFFIDVVLRPLWAFFKVYIINLGFLDGKIGWVFAVAHYYYTTMKYAKLYYLYKCKGKL